VVQTGIAERLVAHREIGFVDLLRTSQALGHVVTGEFDVDAARVGSGGVMGLEESLDLVDNVVEAPRLVAGRGGEPVAVHRVADPERIRIHRLDRLE